MKKENTKILMISGIVLVAAIIVIVAFMALGGNNAATDIEDQMENPGETSSEEPDKVFSLAGGAGFTFNMDGEVNPDLVVNEGDLVRIEFANTDVMPHDWVLDEFGARTEIITNGETSFVEFVADRTGTFEYYCSVGQHRANGMTGSLIVQ